MNMIENKVILVVFLSERCGFCKTQGPILEELRKNIGNKIEIIKIDIDKERDMANELHVTATPTIFILKNDDIFKKFIGLTNRNELESSINNALKS
jgi:thioredoxin 1